MAATLLSSMGIAAGGGLVYAFQQSTAPGRTILLLLFVASIFSWSVMVTKFRILRLAQQQRAGRRLCRCACSEDDDGDEENELFHGHTSLSCFRDFTADLIEAL